PGRRDGPPTVSRHLGTRWQRVRQWRRTALPKIRGEVTTDEAILATGQETSRNQDRLGILAGREARVGRNHLVTIQNARPSGRVLYAGPVDVIDALRGRIAPHDRPTGEIPRADSKRDGRNERRASEEDFLQHASLQG